MRSETWQETQDSLDKRTREDTPSTILRRQDDVRLSGEREDNVTARERFPVSAHAGIAPIEHGGAKRVLGVGAPVHVLNRSASSPTIARVV